MDDNTSTDLTNTSSTVNSVVNVDMKGMSAVAKLLVEKVSEGLGGLFRPRQIVRVAEARAKAGLIAAESELAIAALRDRAERRVEAEEARAQANIEEVLRLAAESLSDDAKPEHLDSDWLANFFDKAKMYTDEEMRAIWASLLAAEAEKPSSFSRRVVNILADLDKRDAHLFQAVCRISVPIGGDRPLVMDVADRVYTELGITFDSLTNLESLGLVQFHGVAALSLSESSNRFGFHYGGQLYVLSHVHSAGSTSLVNFPIGQLMFTRAGEELARLCSREPVPGFPEYLQHAYQKLGWELTQPVVVNRSTTSGAASSAGIDGSVWPSS